MYIHTCFVVADEGDRVLSIPVCDNKELMKLRDMLYFDNYCDQPNEPDNGDTQMSECTC